MRNTLASRPPSILSLPPRPPPATPSDHSESLVRALSARRTRAGPSPGVQRKVMTELVRLRKEVSLSSKSLALLHHETKMTRTAFRVRAPQKRVLVCSP